MDLSASTPASFKEFIRKWQSAWGRAGLVTTAHLNSEGVSYMLYDLRNNQHDKWVELVAFVDDNEEAASHAYIHQLMEEYVENNTVAPRNRAGSLENRRRSPSESTDGGHEGHSAPDVAPDPRAAWFASEMERQARESEMERQARERERQARERAASAHSAPDPRLTDLSAFGVVPTRTPAPTHTADLSAFGVVPTRAPVAPPVPERTPVPSHTTDLSAFGVVPETKVDGSGSRTPPVDYYTDTNVQNKRRELLDCIDDYNGNQSQANATKLIRIRDEIWNHVDTGGVKGYALELMISTVSVATEGKPAASIMSDSG
jgi:hypothetical protein